MLNAIKYTHTRLLFHEDFPSDFKAISQTTTHKLSGMVDNHVLKGMLMERVLSENNAKTLSDLKARHVIAKESLTKGKEIVEKLSMESDEQKHSKMTLKEDIKKVVPKAKHSLF